MLSVYDEQLHAAEKSQASYSEFVAGLLRAQWHERQDSALEWRIRRANLPERWSLESFPWARQPGVNRKQMRAFASREASGSEHLRRPLQVGPQPTHPVHQSISGHSEVCGDIAVSPAVYNPAFQQDAVVISQIPEEGAKPIRGIVHSGDLGGHETGVSVVRLGRRSLGRLRGWCSR